MIRTQQIFVEERMERREEGRREDRRDRGREGGREGVKCRWGLGSASKLCRDS